MSLLDYLDVEDATATALRNITACRLEHSRLPGEIASLGDAIRHLEHSLALRASRKKAAQLEALHAKRTALQGRLLDLEEYLPFFAAAWEHLEQWERDALYCRYIDKALGVRAFSATYHVGKAQSYRKVDLALRRLSRLLYW